MSQSVNSIALPLPLGMRSVNCYLLQAADGYVLVDTGAPNARNTLSKELERRGCRPGTLHLIALTHGDFDHIGNAAHVRATFGGRIAMHADDARVAEVGDMFVSRQKSNFILKALAPRLIGFGKSDRFSADAHVAEGDTLSEYGLEARVITIPGHSRGSIGILTDEGDFFCGDLFDNIKAPALNTLIDDSDAAARSAMKVRSLSVRTVYPGHGKPFLIDQLWGGRLTP